MNIKSSASRILAASALLLSVAAAPGRAADDPSIKGTVREAIQASMAYYIDSKTIGGAFRLYDPVDGKLLKLKFKELHKGIVKKGDFYVSCADFVDGKGKLYDLDFMVLKDGDALHTVQAIVHAAEGKKRPYQLESE
ncbi:MAG: hypothetical protein HYV14_01275 [Elusimicrobia bacterium]|nr:hypothetical protein [Elusimicrobiota bacterium]